MIKKMYAYLTMPNYFNTVVPPYLIKEGGGKSLIISGLILLMFTALQAQDLTHRKITGTVKDTSGNPMPGVGVLEKGTKNEVATDLDGSYYILVNQGSVLEFYNVDFETQNVSIDGKTVIDVILQQKDTKIGKVVVTALGIKRKEKSLGYALTKIEGEEIAARNTVNPVPALQGESAGTSVTISDGGLFGVSKIQVRGISVLNSNNNQPIFVIDGVILENGLSGENPEYEAGFNANDFGNILKNLNPDNFKTLSVLKGAAATALYGSRGMNGAIVIETKEGRKTRGLDITIKQTLGIDRVYKVPDIQYEYGSGTVAGYVTYGEKKPDGTYYRFSTDQIYTDKDGVPTMIGAPALGFGPHFDGRPMIGYDGEMTTYSPRKGNALDIYKTGISRNTYVSLSGGGENSNFFISDSYLHRTGVNPHTSFERNALLFKGGIRFSNWLKANASFSFTSSKPENPSPNNLRYFIEQKVWTNYYDTKKYKQRKYWQAVHGGVPQAQYGDKYADVPASSVWFSTYLNNNIRQEYVTRPIVSLTANITPDLSVKLEGNMNYYTLRGEEKYPGLGYQNEGGYYGLSHSADESKNGKLVFDYNKSFNKDLSGHFVLGGEIFKQEKSYTSTHTDGGLIIPKKYFLGNSKKKTIGSGEIYSTKQINSVYFLANLDYKGQLFLDLTGRNDWSSALVYSNGEGNYSYFYPSASSSWIFSETFSLPQWITFGKLRFSWAQVGNDTQPYLLNKGYYISKEEIKKDEFVYLSSVSNTLVDKKIKPERKNSFELGSDIRLFNSRLNIDASYYDETISDQIGSIPLPIESGYEYLFTNIGALTNRGFELSVTGKPVKTHDFQWAATFNYWNSKTKIKKLHKDYGEYKVLGGRVDWNDYRIGAVAFEGGEYGVLMSDSKPKTYQAVGEDGKPVDDPRNGKKELYWNNQSRGAYYKRSDKVEEVGKIQPDFEGSFKNALSYKNFLLSLSLDARFGGYMASYSNRYGTAYGWLKTSLYGRDPEHGGASWTSAYEDTKGEEFHDGVFPEGVFAQGQKAVSPSGKEVNLGGLTYKEAVEKGYIEPTHASFYHYFRNEWSNGVVNDDWLNEVKYIALREISIGYNFPKSIAKSIGMKNFYASFSVRNLGYLYNSLPNHINPESFRGNNSNSSFMERGLSPYKVNYIFSITMNF